MAACTAHHDDAAGAPDHEICMGMTIADDFPDYTSTACERLCDSLHAAGMNWVAITPCGFLDSTQATSIHWTKWSRRDYVSAIQKIKARGMKVLVKPYLWSMDFWRKKEWTGLIHHEDPTERAAFFASYEAWLLDVVRDAAAGKADMVCIGLELPNLTTDESAWRALIRSCRAVYPGKLTYASHGVDEAQSIRFWDALDVIGVNIYPSLTPSLRPTDDEVRAGWKPILATLHDLSVRWSAKKIVLTEAGFRSVERAMFSPWEWPEHRPRAVAYDEQEQAYRILAEQTYDRPWFGGIFWWKVFTDPDGNDEGRDGFSPFGKPAWKQMAADARKRMQRQKRNATDAKSE